MKLDSALSNAPTMHRLADYQPPSYAIDNVDLLFELEPNATIVTNRMRMQRLDDDNNADVPLVLNGIGLELLCVELDGSAIEPDARDAESITFKGLPKKFSLSIKTKINPEANKALEGLYLSNGRFCTQCEAHGFRHITYYLDRPDVMSVFTTTVVADQAAYPVLLSNGNVIARGKGDSYLNGLAEHVDDSSGADANGANAGNVGASRAKAKHWVRWHDPFKKPCYLFALVAGDLALHSDSFTTMSGRKVALEIYVEPQNRDKTAHAMQSLKASMAWDEQRFGLEYDLDIYMIVAVNDFNMGAMENKGLNVFNAKYVLASPATATDDDYDGIESVIAHEYFHNWTGNRITCRDWFQLSLKEGLTVYRDQEFSSDMNSRSLQRIADVKRLREFQFSEDAGPTAHPIRPDTYGEVNNMYTATVYEKGAEVIRMQATMLGEAGFRKGMDLYFARHDGQAVTCEDFTQCMQDANDVDWQQFLLWYSTAGTPEIQVFDRYNEQTQTYVLTVKQRVPDTPGQTNKRPMLIPLAVALYADDGTVLREPEVLLVTDAEQSFEFKDIDPAIVEQGVTPSLLRGLSAPVKLHYAYSTKQLLTLMRYDDDAFTAWDAAQRLQIKVILNLMPSVEAESTGIFAAGLAAHETLNTEHAQVADTNGISDLLLAAIRALLQRAADPNVSESSKSNGIDWAQLAEMLTMPSMNRLAEHMAVVDVDRLHAARLAWQNRLANELMSEWLAVYTCCAEVDNAAARRLKNLALQALCAVTEPVADTDEADDNIVVIPQNGYVLAMQQMQQATNMTDQFGGLKALVWSPVTAAQVYADQALVWFAERWADEPLVLDKWLMLQATVPHDNTLANVSVLIEHHAFDAENPNRIRSLIGAFARMNEVGFHALDGGGYEFVADWVIRLDQKNPQVAAALVSAFNRWRRYDETRQHLMCAALQRIAASVESSNVLDIVNRALPD